MRDGVRITAGPSQSSSDHWRLPVGHMLDPYTILIPFPTQPEVTRTTVGEACAFKTSIGAEIRFFMPVLNVPFP